MNFSSIENHTGKYILSTWSLLDKWQYCIIFFYQGGAGWFENVYKDGSLYRKPCLGAFLIRAAVHNGTTVLY